MDAVFVVVLAMLGVAATLTLARLLLGPSTLDRIVALDVFVVLSVVAAGVYVAYYRDGSNIPLLAAVALVGFVGSVTAARLAVRRDGDGESVTAWTSRDGEAWARGATWTHDLGEGARIGLVAMGGPGGFAARFDHLRVRRLPG